MLSQILATLGRTVRADEYSAVCQMLLIAHLPAEPDAIAWVEPARDCLGCKGTGRVPSRHTMGYGPCAACKATGRKAAVEVTGLEALRELVRLMRADNGEKADAAFQQWMAIPAETRKAAIAAAAEAMGDFGESVRKTIRFRGRLTPGQVAALTKAAPAKAPAAKPVTAPLKAGRQPLKGTIVSMKEQDGQYGTQIKVLIRLDTGARVFGTCPAALVSKVKAGDEIALTATVQPKEADFGFFSRPTVG